MIIRTLDLFYEQYIFNKGTEHTIKEIPSLDKLPRRILVIVYSEDVESRLKEVKDYNRLSDLINCLLVYISSMGGYMLLVSQE